MASIVALRLLASATGSILSRAKLPLHLRSLHATSYRSAHYLNASPEVFTEIAVKKSAESSRVVLVDFYADWCQPCKLLSPVLEKLTNDVAIKSGSGQPLDLVTVDTQTAEGMKISQDYQVRAMPTVVVFKGGKEVTRFIGAIPEPRIRELLEKL